jgi:hypothetical protein
MSKKDENATLKQFSAVVSIIAFIADLITVLVFVKDLLFNFDFLSFESTISQIFIIALIFTFAILLFNYSREINKGLEGVVKMFGWLYVILAALIFMIVSFRFIMGEDYGFGEFIGYPLLVISIAGLGFGVTKNVEGNTKYFSIPFMIVALEQIALWVIKILVGYGLLFTLPFFGNLLLFVIVGLIILFFLQQDEW